MPVEVNSRTLLQTLRKGAEQWAEAPPSLPRMLVSHRARSSFMGSRLASWRLASHWWYCCMSVRPGTPGCLGLRELHMVPYWTPAGRKRHTEG